MTDSLNAVNNLGTNYYIEQKDKKSAEKKQHKPLVSEMEYTNKKDGKTYVARKVLVKENGQYLAYVSVFEKGAKPDENGNIKREVMSIENFMQKLGDELPSITSGNVKAYNPNIRTMTPEERFDKGLINGVKLSDGSTLVRPNTENTGLTEIKSLGAGLYEVKSTSFVGGHKHIPQVRVISEKQLLNNRFLCAGTIKALDDGTYDIRSFDHDKLEDKKVNITNQDKAYCVGIIKTGFVHF